VTVVIGTAGHIDHGKTSLLRALTGIDADRLPEERRRGMTIDVGYAHLALDDGTEIDFVDVPGHDRLVGNMLVGAGEVDAALLVVAADDGPRAQTSEHLELLDALGIGEGLVAITKIDQLAPDDPRRETVRRSVRELLAGTTLADVPVLAVSSTTGEGLTELRSALVALRDRVAGRSGPATRPPRLAIDRVFGVRGRGTVVTGTLRGGPLATGRSLRLEPDGRTVRVRGIQVHGHPVEGVYEGGRAALNLAGIETAELNRGGVLAGGPDVVATDRLLVAIRPPTRSPATRRLRPGATVRLHLGTDQVDAKIGRGRNDGVELDGEEVVRVSLARPIAAAVGDRFVLRWPSPASTAAGGRVLDAVPPSGVARRRADPARLRALAEADGPSALLAALVALHGVLSSEQAGSVLAAHGSDQSAVLREGSREVSVGSVDAVGRVLVARDIVAEVELEAIERVAAHYESKPLSPGMALSELRPLLARAIRRRASLTPAEAGSLSADLVDRIVRSGRLARSGDHVRDPARSAEIPEHVLAAMARLEASLDVPSPPSFTEAIRAAACPSEGVRALESSGRIVRLDTDIAYAAETYRRFEALALTMAATGPVAPAAFRDATGTSRKFSLALLEELDRRGLLRRTPAGHLLGPRAPRDR
jgi:selenocysteine-specific elongation factor